LSEYGSLSSSLCSFLHSRHLILLRPKYSPQYIYHPKTRNKRTAGNIWIFETCYLILSFSTISLLFGINLTCVIATKQKKVLLGIH
jgi:hypothetical protein